MCYQIVHLTPSTTGKTGHDVWEVQSLFGRKKKALEDEHRGPNRIIPKGLLLLASRDLY